MITKSNVSLLMFRNAYFIYDNLGECSCGEIHNLKPIETAALNLCKDSNMHQQAINHMVGTLV